MSWPNNTPLPKQTSLFPQLQIHFPAASLVLQPKNSYKLSANQQRTILKAWISFMHIHKNKLLSNRLDKYQSQHKDDSKSSSASSMITNILVPTVIKRYLFLAKLWLKGIHLDCLFLKSHTTEIPNSVFHFLSAQLVNIGAFYSPYCYSFLLKHWISKSVLTRIR